MHDSEALQFLKDDLEERVEDLKNLNIWVIREPHSEKDLKNARKYCSILEKRIKKLKERITKREHDERGLTVEDIQRINRFHRGFHSITKKVIWIFDNIFMIFKQ